MFTLKGRQDNFRCTLPKEFIPQEIEEKYAKIITNAKSFVSTPIDFLNETIQGVDILGFTQAAAIQQQHGIGTMATSPSTIDNNLFLHGASDVAYRSEMNPLNLIDKTLRITFRHVLGFTNYFMLLESFWIMYRRDTYYKDMPGYISIDLFDEIGSKISRIVVYNPIIDGIDMLSLNYTNPVAASQTFNMELKYSNIAFEFINQERLKSANEYRDEVTTVISSNSPH